MGSWRAWCPSPQAVVIWKVAVLLPLVWLAVLCIPLDPCCCKSSRLMTQWMPAQCTASAVPGGSSLQVCSIGAGALTITMVGAASVAWRMMMDPARPASVAVLLQPNLSWSWSSSFGLVASLHWLSPSWRWQACCGTANMWRKWASILIITLHPRLMLWVLILSRHPKPMQPWLPNSQLSEKHINMSLVDINHGSVMSWAYEIQLGCGASHNSSAYSVWNHASLQALLSLFLASSWHTQKLIQGSCTLDDVSSTGPKGLPISLWPNQRSTIPAVGWKIACLSLALNLFAKSSENNL